MRTKYIYTYEMRVEGNMRIVRSAVASTEKGAKSIIKNCNYLADNHPMKLVSQTKYDPKGML